MKENLLKSIVNCRAKHPERMNATFERIEEVLTLLAENNLLNSFKTQTKNWGIKNKRSPLTKTQGEKIAEFLASHLSPRQIRKMSRLLHDAEISTREAIDLHEAFKIPVSQLEKDLVFVRGEGVWKTDTKGDKYLDMDSNYSATNLGMANPEIARGLFNQATQFISTKEDRVHIPRARFIKVIHKIMPKGLTHFFWQNSGGEAVDKAIKIAKAYTGQKGTIAFEGGFHGRTHGALAVTYNQKYRKPFLLHQEDWVHFVPYNDTNAVEKVLQSGQAKIVILELVQGEEAGIRLAEKSFVKKLRALCNQYKAVLICDEVQSGFGRTATKPGEWWACQTYEIAPDIMTIGKSFGGGYPVTAVVTSPEISRAMKPGYDGSTFGGNPMAMVAAFIAIRQMQEKDLTTNVVARNRQFVDGLKKMHSPLIQKIRSLGLMIGIDLPTKQDVQKFQDTLKQHGVHSSLSTEQTVRFLPPLIISENEVEFALKGIAGTLKKMAAENLALIV
ncbi:MAG: aspartate aminotransferase family protein [Planctomycetes bacterium]|nr:aspartate aminotransferase family protein [Planctomycetota bacterium]